MQFLYRIFYLLYDMELFFQLNIQFFCNLFHYNLYVFEFISLKKLIKK